MYALRLSDLTTVDHDDYVCYDHLRIYVIRMNISNLHHRFRLNCQKAAMRSLRLARNHSSSEHEMLVYEGWILYDTGNREEALASAEKSISIQRSFEAFFLKAYVLADTNLNPKSSSCVIQLLEEALKCPSDGLRKGQVRVICAFVVWHFELKYLFDGNIDKNCRH